MGRHGCHAMLLCAAAAAACQPPSSSPSPPSRRDKGENPFPLTPACPQGEGILRDETNQMVRGERSLRGRQAEFGLFGDHTGPNVK